MAKKSINARNKKRIKIAARYAGKRAAIKRKMKHAQTIEERMALQAELERFPRDASPIRIRNRCRITGRPRGYYRKFGLSRNMLRLFAMLGDVPGLTKASW